MFNLGFGEILVICVVLIIVVGPERLPAVMKNVGKAMRTVRQASREIQSTVGMDELWREDVLAPPRPRIPPSATVSRPAEPSAAAPADVAPAIAPAAAPALQDSSTPPPSADPPPPSPKASEPIAAGAQVTGSGGTKGEG